MKRSVDRVLTTLDRAVGPDIVRAKPATLAEGARLASGGLW